MKKEPKYKIFIKLFYYWLGRLDVKIDIPASKDNRYNGYALIVEEGNKTILKYNSKKLGQCKKSFLVCAVFHEIAHIINKFPYNTEKEKIYSEYEAERFSLDMLKIYYSKLYKDNNKIMKKRMKNSRWIRKQDNWHKEAYRKIKEYND